MQRLLVATLMLLVFVVPASADNFEVAYSAYNRGDFQTASRLLIPLAEAGDSRAQFLVGALYDANKVPSDKHPFGRFDAPAQALTWYWRAAEQGHADAQVVMGSRYAEGWGVPQDLVEAAKWFNLAAAAGNGDATLLLDRLSGKMTGQEISHGQMLAKEWRPTPE